MRCQRIFLSSRCFGAQDKCEAVRSLVSLFSLSLCSLLYRIDKGWPVDKHTGDSKRAHTLTVSNNHTATATLVNGQSGVNVGTAGKDDCLCQLSSLPNRFVASLSLADTKKPSKRPNREGEEAVCLGRNGMSSVLRIRMTRRNENGVKFRALAVFSFRHGDENRRHTDKLIMDHPPVT